MRRFAFLITYVIHNKRRTKSSSIARPAFAAGRIKGPNERYADRLIAAKCGPNGKLVQIPGYGPEDAEKNSQETIDFFMKFMARCQK
jgi:hypothetical protein